MLIQGLQGFLITSAFSIIWYSRKAELASGNSLLLGIPPPAFQPLQGYIAETRNYWWLCKNVTQLLTEGKTTNPLSALLANISSKFIILLELLGFTLALDLTHNFVLYLSIVTAGLFLSSNLRSLECRQVQNHSCGNSSGDSGFRISTLEVKAELLIATLEYLQVWPKEKSKHVVDVTF